MNYLAHALPFLDRPYMAVATGVPDMLMVVDRRVRVRSEHALPFVDCSDPVQSAVARGVLQHLRDDATFHETLAFVELNLALCEMVRGALAGESSMRPRLLSHLLVEVFLDAALAAEQPEKLEAYYRALESVDADRMQTALNRMAPRPAFRLADMIRAVRHDQFLWDYLEDATLIVRLNQILRRVRLAALPAGFQACLAPLRRLVAARKDDLLEAVPARPVRRQAA